MLDKPQLELIKGLIDMNLGEPIEEFEKPSTVIRDPIAQVRKCMYMVSLSLFLSSNYEKFDAFHELSKVIHMYGATWKTAEVYKDAI